MPPAEPAPPPPPAEADGHPPDHAATRAQALAQTTAILRTAGLDDPSAEARWLLLAATGLRAVDLVLEPSRPLDAAAASRLAEWTDRRARHEPLSRILGVRAFYGRDFALSPETLDPRPDTETLVALALDLARVPPVPGWPRSILDVGTGSGAILVTLLTELPGATGVGLDISAGAITTAAENAARHGVAARARFAVHDVREGIPGNYDLIVSNPPYVPSNDIAGLAPEVRLHDPTAALDGGGDGLDFYRLLAVASGACNPGGWLVVEVGAGQADDVAAILLQVWPGATIRTATDLGGHIRVVAVQPRAAVARE